MITKKQLADLILLIAVEYPQDIDLSETALKLKVGFWFEELGAYDYATVEYAVKQALRRSHFCPKLADVLGGIADLEAASNPSAAELWALIECKLVEAVNLASCFSYTFCPEGLSETQGETARRKARELYENLPEPAKLHFGNLSGFMRVAHYDDYQFEKARFLKSYTGYLEREKTKAELAGNAELEKITDDMFKRLNDGKTEEEE